MAARLEHEELVRTLPAKISAKFYEMENFVNERMPYDELEDAINAAVSYGFDEGDFTFQRIAYPPLRSGLAPLIADVVAVHTPSGIKRTYQIDSRPGVGYSWPAEFERDVKAGVFDS